MTRTKHPRFATALLRTSFEYLNRNFETGRILHRKIENRNPKIGRLLGTKFDSSVAAVYDRRSSLDGTASLSNKSPGLTPVAWSLDIPPLRGDSHFASA